jgi:Chromo (CHRromatin Organisation MOdifier) domain
MAPFELFISRPAVSFAILARPRDEEQSVSAAKQEFLERLNTLRIQAQGNLHVAQTRYKQKYDRGIRTKNAHLQEGDQAYFKVEVTELDRNSKMESLVEVPYVVVENAGTTLRLQIGDEVVHVSSDRVTPAPRPTTITTSSPATTPPSSDNSGSEVTTRSILRSPHTPRRGHPVRFSVPPTAVPNNPELLIDRLVDAEAGMFLVRWLGYSETEDTWKPEGNIPRQFIRRYWRRRGVDNS